ncbi:MAG TPA: TerB N-terminal domain-containing protein, partial [Chloroflexota bacterium]|nr:TerB N-terminal domain-containing protein [Chloroflexota bacterium]
GEAITVGSYSIRNPLTYGARRVAVGTDRTCIDFSLSVGAAGQISSTSTAMYASYRDLTAPERGAYLQWLAAGRTRFPDPPAFMAMFLGGIERRLLLDKRDGNMLVGELVRLLPLCPADDGARTLIYKLLAYAFAVHYVTDLSLSALEALADQLEVKNNMTVDVAVLGWLSAWQKPIPAKWAVRLLWRLRVAQRLGTTGEFAQHRDAFVAAFDRTFSEGFVLKLPPTTRLITYHPTGHAVLELYSWASCPAVTVPDALTCDELTPLLTLWRACTRPATSRKTAEAQEGGERVQADKKRPWGAARRSKPAQPPVAAAARVDLDPQAVQRVLADTEAAQRLLAGVFVSEEPAPRQAPPHRAELAPDPSPKHCPPGLPTRYQPVLQALLEQADWELSVFVALVRRHRLMPADTIAAINTWSEESLGDLLIEDNGDVHVNASLIEKHE